MTYENQKQIDGLYEEIRNILKVMCDINHPPSSKLMNVKGEIYQAEVEIIWKKYQKM